MRIPNFSMRHSIFMRMITLYLIVVLPIILLSLYLYTWSYNNASREISRVAELQLISYLEDLEREMTWLEMQMFNIMEDHDIHRSAVTWSLMDRVSQKDSLNYVLHRLAMIKNSSTLIRDVYVHLRPAGKTISALTGINAFDSERFSSLVKESQQQDGRLLMLEDNPQLAAMKRSGVKDEQPLFIVQIELDTNELKASLARVNLYTDSGAFLVSETIDFALASLEDSEQLMNNYLKLRDLELTTMLIRDEHGQSYQMNHVYSEELQMTVVTYLSEEEVKRPLSKFKLWAWLYAFVTLLAVVIYSYISYKKVHKPLLLLVKGFRKMEGGDLDIHIDHNQRDEFGYLYDRFNQMIRRLQNLIEQDFKHQMMMQKAELKQLQSQINPHFLYNSFFILHSMAKIGDVERIEEFTLMIGEYFRFITRNGEDFVRLADEVHHSRMYTEIQKLRFSRRIKVEFAELSAAVERIKVPKLIIQPIIENAYEHSLENTEEGFLRVDFQIEDEMLSIIIENNGEISDADLEQLQYRLERSAESYEMTGMINIHRRLQLAYGEDSGLILSRSELGGLRVMIQIKLDDKEVDGSAQDAHRG